MNEKEIAELRRRYRRDKSNITHVRGCLVNENREIVSEFDQSLITMPEDEAEKLLSVLKRTLSGTLGKNLVDIAFTTEQVLDSEEHRLLMSLRNSSLQDTEAVQGFFQQVVKSVTLEGNYLILLAQDTYDVCYRSADGEKQGDASSEVFSYILCSVCPIKTTKPALSYYVYQNEFHNLKEDWIVGAPELGFLFPAFDDRSTNLYNALYYTRDSSDNHEEFIASVFNSEVPMPAAVQKETFQAILGETLEEDCSYGVVQAVHDQLSEIVEVHKTNKEIEPLVISKGTVKDVLGVCGVSKDHVTAFEEKYDDEFGSNTDLSLRNIIDTNQFEVRTSDVTVRINPERKELIETRMIDGTKYILIRVEEGVEVNGVPIHIS